MKRRWSDLTLHHYCHEPFQLRPVSYLQQPLQLKPNGLWFAIDDGWVNYLAGAERRTPSFRYRVRLDPAARILHLTSTQALDRFGDRYGNVPEPLRHTCAVRSLALMIDWPAVVADYAGIIIAPWKRHWIGETGHFFVYGAWYISWDCSSGCVWDLDAIASFRRVPTARTSASAHTIPTST